MRTWEIRDHNSMALWIGESDSSVDAMTAAKAFTPLYPRLTLWVSRKHGGGWRLYLTFGEGLWRIPAAEDT